MIKYYLDTHIAKAVAIQLRNLGIFVIRCEEVGLAEADDIEHLEYAHAQQLVLVTHDRGFWKHQATLWQNGLQHSGIVLIDRIFQGDVGRIVVELKQLYELIAQGVGTLENDIYNRIYEVK